MKPAIARLLLTQLLPCLLLILCKPRLLVYPLLATCLHPCFKLTTVFLTALSIAYSLLTWTACLPCVCNLARPLLVSDCFLLAVCLDPFYDQTNL